VGLFGNKNTDFEKQLQHETSKIETGIAQQMMDPSNVAMDPQVSAMILRNGDFFLQYHIDKETGDFILDKKYEGFVEPGGIDPYAFLSEKKGDGEFLNDLDNVLTSILDYGNKYGIDDNVRNAFNKLARKRIRFLNNSRTLEGRPQQLAKSQIIRATGGVYRETGQGQKRDKFLGFL